MTRLLEILISLVIVAVLFVVVGVLLPANRTLVEQVETNRRQTIVFDTINSFRRFHEWHPMALYDPRMGIERSGPEEGEGATMSYSSDVRNVGTGKWTIVESVPRREVKIAIEDDRQGTNKQTTFALRPTGRGGRNIQITQTYSVDYGWNLLGRYAGLYVSRSIGDSMTLGLNRLSNMLSAVPNVDYAVDGTTLENLRVFERPAENLLVVRAGAIERRTAEIQGSMESNMEWINRTMETNDLEAAGPMRIVTTELGRDTYNFDVVLPVRSAGSGPAAADSDAEEGNGEEAEAETATAAVEQPMVDEGELSDLELLGPVEYVRAEPTLVAGGDYTGFMAELENVRNAIRAWAMTQGHEVTGRPFEMYKSGIEDSFTPEGQYEVYWTVKQ
ncbi:MAG TPA: SRPBCC family protein [Candidatus Luteimonas excrementigallinarum]|nr:SRPBCC family protein [Candidatus Luteimonas excrementigallinarum]